MPDLRPGPWPRHSRPAPAVFAGLLTGLLTGFIASVWTERAGASETPVTIFAAASTGGAIEAVARDYEAGGGGPVRTVLAASSTLARQIDHGAPADLYLSANVAWMDWLAARSAVAPNSRIDLLGNSLVLIAPADRPFQIAVAPGFALAEALGGGRLAMADPDHVPAGIYARAALSALGVWSQVAPRAVYSNDVRAALVLVERGEVAAGIVYASDARASARVRVVAEFPPDTHPPIVYPLAILRDRDWPTVRDFHRYLQGPRAGAIFRARGFAPLALAD